MGLSQSTTLQPSYIKKSGIRQNEDGTESQAVDPTQRPDCSSSRGTSKYAKEEIIDRFTWPPLPVYPLVHENGTNPDNYLTPCTCKICRQNVEQKSGMPRFPRPIVVPAERTEYLEPTTPLKQQAAMPRAEIKRTFPSQCKAAEAAVAAPESRSCSRDVNESMTDFQRECLDAHNHFRCQHRNCPPLTLSKDLCAYAEQWAKKLADIGRLEHRSVHTYGENLYMSTYPTVDGFTVVKSWYDEIRFYDYSLPQFSPGTGHFSQVVWRDSKLLGAGIAKKNGKTYVVCNYNPYGNVAGVFEQNVTPSI